MASLLLYVESGEGGLGWHESKRVTIRDVEGGDDIRKGNRSHENHQSILHIHTGML
jgi:hypothetical protein